MECNGTLHFIVGLLGGFILALGLVCLYQFLGDELDSFPVQQVLSIF